MTENIENLGPLTGNGFVIYSLTGYVSETIEIDKGTGTSLA